MKITIVCSIKDSEKLEIVKMPDKFCKDGLVYTFSNDKISLYHCANEIEDLKEQLNKAEKVIEYYATMENWDFEEIDKSDVEFCEDPQAELGGKRARDFLLKRGKMNNDEYLKEQLNKAKEVISYYANVTNWDNANELYKSSSIEISDHYWDDDFDVFIGGKRARDFLLKLEGKCKIVE